VRPSFLRYTVLRPWLWRWHRRAGLFSAFVLILLTISGVMLNHTSEIGLNKKFVGQSWLLSFYGIPEPELVSFGLPTLTITGDDKGQLYRDSEPLQACRGTLVGVALYRTGFIAACEQELLFFDVDGSLTEKVSAVYGLPTPVEHLGQCGTQLCIRTPKRLFELDVEQLSFVPLVGAKPQWSESVTLAAPVRQAIVNSSRGQGLHWEQVLLDLHSGRLFGTPGVWVVDIAALLLFFLAMSGFVLWYQHMAVKRSRHQGD
jgi:hypothetical protein